MPFLLFGIGVVAILWIAARSKSAAVPPVPPKQLPAKTTAVTTKQGAVTSVLNQAAALFASAAYGSKSAQTVATFGLGIAIAVGTVNLAAGVIIAIVVLLVSAFLDFGGSISDLTQDHHQAGLDAYDTQWAQVQSGFIDSINSRAMLSNQKPDPVQLALISAAYADGFMRHSNYLKAFTAYCGGIWGTNGAQPDSGGVAVRRLWLTGGYAGAQTPAPSMKAYLALNLTIQDSRVMVSFQQDASAAPYVTDDKWDNGDNYAMALYEPACKSPGEGTIFNSYPANYGKRPMGDTSIPDGQAWDTWFCIGIIHANAAGMVMGCQDPVGTFQSQLSSLQWYRDHGFFFGPLKAKSDLPPDAYLGVAFRGYTAYTTPDFKQTIFLEGG